MKLQLAAVALASLCLGACTQVNTPQEITLRTDAALVDCYRMFVVPKGCFLTYRSDDNTLYSSFGKSEIQGFVFEEGYEYTLRIALQKLNNPPADAPDTSYRLVRIEAKTPKLSP